MTTITIYNRYHRKVKYNTFRALVNLPLILIAFDRVVMDSDINSPVLTVTSLPLDLMLDTILLAMTLAPM